MPVELVAGVAAAGVIVGLLIAELAIMRPSRKALAIVQNELRRARDQAQELYFKWQSAQHAVDAINANARRWATGAPRAPTSTPLPLGTHPPVAVMSRGA